FRHSLADDDSIGSAVALRHRPQARYFPPVPRAPPAAHVHAVFFSARSVTPSGLKTFQGFQATGKRRKLPAGPCSPRDVIRPRLFLRYEVRIALSPGGTAGLATGGAFPARYGRSGRWP